MPSKKVIGALVRKARLNKGLTQEGLAAKTGLSRSYICDVENGRYASSLETLFKISSALDVSVNQLVTVEGECL